MLWLVGAWLALCALAWLALPSLLKSQLQTRGSAALGRTLSIGSVEFKPWTLELAINRLAVATADGKSTQFSVERLYADAELQSLLRLAPVVDAITVEAPHLVLTHQGEGHYDVDDVLQRLLSGPKEPASAPLRFALYNLVLSDGSVDFTDHMGKTERVHTLRALNLALPFVSSFDSQRTVKVQPHLAFDLNGSHFDSAAQATPFAPDAQGNATLEIQHLDIAPYLPYVPTDLPVRLKAAVLDSSLKLAFTQAPAQKVEISGLLTVSGLDVADATGAPLLQAASVQVDIAALRPLEQQVQLHALTVNSPQLSLRRNAAGAWNVAAANGTAAATPAPVPAPNQAPAPAWQLALERLQINGAEVRLQDATLAPPAQLALRETRVDLRDLHWPMADKAAQLEASALLQSPSLKGQAAHVALQGSGTDASGTAQLKLSGLDLGLARPYLAKLLAPQASGVLDGEWTAQWKGEAVQLQAPRTALHDFALTPTAASADLKARDLPSFKLLELKDLHVDLAGHAVTLGQLSLQKPTVRLARDAQGKWMYANWLLNSAAAAPTTAAPLARSPGAQPNAASGAVAKSPAWTLNVADVALDDGTVSWVDRAAPKPVFLEFSALQAHASRLSLDGKKPAPLTLSAKVRTVRSDAGSLRFDGNLMWDPLVVQGALDIKQFPAQAVAPYGMAGLRLDLLRADSSFKGQVRYASLATGADLHLQGDAAVEELRLNSAEKSASGETLSEELLSWKALSVPGIDCTLSPGRPLRLQLGEVSLSDFYARLIVNAQGRLVLQDIATPEPAGTAVADSAAPAASAPASAVSVPAAPVPANDRPRVDVAGLRLVNGHVAFSDRFIKPNYSADLTELAGSLGRFSTQAPQGGVQMADLDLRGKAEGTASLEVAGKVNPLAKPLALDIAAKVRDLELSPLSSYAIKYAGYGIERGRLSVDLNYAVSPDGQLQASNKIVLNQLVFGDAAAGSPHTLPVKLAVALLADGNGVIDLNVPVSGSLNDPQFRVWPIIWKVIGNVLTKALTSPFSLISGLTGGGGAAPEELSHVAFDPGTARISAAALPALDQIAQALRDKQSLRLTIVGTGNLEREREAMRRSRLDALLLAEKRRQAATAGQDVTAVADVTPAEYPALLKAVYQRAPLKKPRNVLGFAKDVPSGEMQAQLLDSLPVDEDAVRELALNRSLAVREYLTAHQVPSASLFLGVVETAPEDAAWQPRADLSVESH